MIRNQMKKFALLLTLLLVLPFLWGQSAAVASAATPAFTASKVEIVGEGNTKQLEIKNKVSGSTYKWSSSKTTVARVSAKGVVTATGKGTTTISCKMTYPTGTTKTITCKVTVTIPAEDIKINNAKEVNGAHILKLGEKFDFNNDITPANSSDQVYWSIAGGDKSCITINDSKKGIVTATKAGKVILAATAVKSATQEEAKKSIINDHIIIEVVGPSARVGSVEFIGSTELKVVFDSPINQNTVIGVNNSLLSNIEISTRKDVKGVMAADPGALTASLSADLMTLTIRSANAFDGEYGINFTSNIKTTDGIAIESYYKRLSFIDTIPPAIENIYTDETGMITTIKFTEAIDFTNFKVSGAQVLGSGMTANSISLNILNEKKNYIVSEDKKSVSINLSGMSPTDYGKTFSVIFTGIKDMKGNMPGSYLMTVYLKADNTPKPQAKVLDVIRTGYNTITATFDRAIATPGYIIIEGSYANGVVDAKDNKKVNYIINDYIATFTGSRKVSIGYWSSYNVSPTDTSANKMYDYYVDFTSDITSPILLDYHYDAKTNILTLIYNEDVSLTSNSGVFTAKLETISNIITPGLNITYTKATSTDSKVIKLVLGNISVLGNYKFTLVQGFVIDSYRNMSMSRDLIISNATDSELTLQAPLIKQDPSNLDRIYLEFGVMLDRASAENVSNYSIPGVPILMAELNKNDPDTGATVILTVATNAIAVSEEWPISIKGVKGYNGSFSALNDTYMIKLKENVRPSLLNNAPAFDKSTQNLIRFNFSEEVTGTMRVKVTQQTSAGFAIEFTHDVIVMGNNVLISLNDKPINGTLLRIDILNNSITDINGNAFTASQYYNVPIYY